MNSTSNETSSRSPPPLGSGTPGPLLFRRVLRLIRFSDAPQSVQPPVEVPPARLVMPMFPFAPTRARGIVAWGGLSKPEAEQMPPFPAVDGHRERRRPLHSRQCHRSSPTGPSFADCLGVDPPKV
jgi:hypothetical protein